MTNSSVDTAGSSNWMCLPLRGNTFIRPGLAGSGLLTQKEGKHTHALSLSRLHTHTHTRCLSFSRSLYFLSLTHTHTKVQGPPLQMRYHSVLLLRQMPLGGVFALG